MTGGSSAATTVELRLFGRFVVLADGFEVPASAFGGRKVRQLLRILATRRESHVSLDALTEMLWPTTAPRDPAANLAVLATRARRAVGCRDLIASGDAGYRIGLPEDRCRVDTEDFASLVRAARTADASDALDSYRAAVAMWAGDPLGEDQYDDWAIRYRDMMSEYRVEALERGVELCLARSDTAQAAEWAVVLATVAPLRESAVVAAMRAFAAHGDPNRALVIFDRFRHDLATELGVDPTAEARAEYQRLLHSRPPRTPHRPAARPSVAPSGLGSVRFVGRSRELDRLRSATMTPAGSVVVVEGRSGTGKSRLVAEFRANRDAAVVRCFAAQRDEVWSMVASLVRELLSADARLADDLPPPLRGALATLVPDLVSGRHPRVDPESMRALVIEVLVRLVGTAAVPTIVLDDIQWSDESSLSAVSVAIRRSPGSSWVLTYRTEEVHPGSPRHAAVGAIEPDLRLALAGLDDEAVRELVADRVVADTLLEHTDSSPLAVVEGLRALAAAGLIEPDRQGRWHATGADREALRAVAHANQQENLTRRLDAVGGADRDVVDLLAIVGRETPAGELARVLVADPAAVLDSLTRLAHADLLRLGEQGWAAAHDMISDVAVRRLDPVRRARLHSLAATAADDVADPVAAAHHWRLAGDAPKAAAAYATAARAALDGFAHDEAVSLASAGLGIEVRTSVATSAALREVRALARARIGDLPGARDDFRAALACALPGPRQAVVLAELAMVASGSDDMIRAADLCEMAVVRAGRDRAARARALEVGSVLDMNLAREQRAAERADEAIALYTELGNAAGVARVLDARAMATFLDGQIELGGDLLARAADLFAASGDLIRVVTPRSTHGHSLVFAARPDEGLEEASLAVEIARTLGHQEGISYALWHRSEASSALGRIDDALRDGREALEIAHHIGHRGWTATAHRAIGIAHQTAGDPDAARSAFRASLDASEHLDLFGSWARSRLAMIEIGAGHLDSAADLVTKALVTGPGLGRHEARLARVLLAGARGDDDIDVLVADLEATAGPAGAHAVVEACRLRM